MQGLVHCPVAYRWLTVATCHCVLCAASVGDTGDVTRRPYSPFQGLVSRSSHRVPASALPDRPFGWCFSLRVERKQKLASLVLSLERDTLLEKGRHCFWLKGCWLGHRSHMSPGRQSPADRGVSWLSQPDKVSFLPTTLGTRHLLPGSGCKSKSAAGLCGCLIPDKGSFT